MKTGSRQPTNRGLGCWNLYQRKDLHYPLLDKCGNNTLVAVLKSCRLHTMETRQLSFKNNSIGVFGMRTGSMEQSVSGENFNVQLTRCLKVDVSKKPTVELRVDLSLMDVLCLFEGTKTTKKKTLKSC